MGKDIMWIMKFPNLVLNEINMNSAIVFENFNDQDKIFDEYVNSKIVVIKDWIDYYKKYEKENSRLIDFYKKELNLWIYIRENRIFSTSQIMYYK